MMNFPSFFLWPIKKFWDIFLLTIGELCSFFFFATDSQKSECFFCRSTSKFSIFLMKNFVIFLATDRQKSWVFLFLFFFSNNLQIAHFFLQLTEEFSYFFPRLIDNFCDFFFSWPFNEFHDFFPSTDLLILSLFLAGVWQKLLFFSTIYWQKWHVLPVNSWLFSHFTFFSVTTDFFPP